MSERRLTRVAHFVQQLRSQDGTREMIRSFEREEDLGDVLKALEEADFAPWTDLELGPVSPLTQKWLVAAGLAMILGENPSLLLVFEAVDRDTHGYWADLRADPGRRMELINWLVAQPVSLPLEGMISKILDLTARWKSEERREASQPSFLRRWLGYQAARSLPTPSPRCRDNLVESQCGVSGTNSEQCDWQPLTQKCKLRLSAGQVVKLVQWVHQTCYGSSPRDARDQLAALLVNLWDLGLLPWLGSDETQMRLSLLQLSQSEGLKSWCHEAMVGLAHTDLTLRTILPKPFTPQKRDLWVQKARELLAHGGDRHPPSRQLTDLLDLAIRLVSS